MPAHHRFHPYEIQVLWLFLSLAPFVAAIFFAYTARHIEAIRRGRKPVTVASRPVLTGLLASD